MTHSPVLASRVSLPLLFGLAATGALPGVATAEVDLDALGTKIVRVVVGADSAASGFLWQAADQVVTSLHAVPGNDMEIKVGCNAGNAPQVARARVVKVYAKADLVLLKTERPLTNCGVFDARQAQEQKPASLSTLYTFGFHAGASGATAREMKKMDARPEDLLSMLHEPVRSQMASFNIPDVRLPIYYVQGGLLPGYSGAPVVDANNRLVGIVDGGLDKGTSGYNWVIPVENLKYLVVSQESQVPGKVREKGAEHFSSGIASADKRTVLAFELKGRAYRFVRTKIRSLRELAASSDDPAGAARLLQLYGPTVGMEAAEQLRFEIFEDLDKGLIIAVPAGEKAGVRAPAARLLLAESVGGGRAGQGRILERFHPVRGLVAGRSGQHISFATVERSLCQRSRAAAAHGLSGLSEAGGKVRGRPAVGPRRALHLGRPGDQGRNPDHAQAPVDARL